MNFMVAAEVSGRTYNNIGVPDAFHAVSHHANDPVKKDKLVKIQHYHTQVLAKFLKKMQDTPDGDGSLLDHSIILYGKQHEQQATATTSSRCPPPSSVAVVER